MAYRRLPTFKMDINCYGLNYDLRSLTQLSGNITFEGFYGPWWSFFVAKLAPDSCKTRKKTTTRKTNFPP